MMEIRPFLRRELDLPPTPQVLIWFLFGWVFFYIFKVKFN